MAEKTYKRISNGFVLDPEQYSNKIRNRLFALEVKINELAPLAHVLINLEKRTVDINGEVKFSDLKKVAKYISKIEVILNRNEII